MNVHRLHLYNWRNYEELHVELVPGVNLLIGDNAQGKTNLLEAIVYLSQGRAFRTRKESELIRIGADFADLQAELSGTEREQSLRAVLFSGRRPRQLYLGGVKQKSASALSGILPAVLFCPEDLLVLKTGASSRRRLLDSALCQLRPSYAQAIGEYGRLLEQKNRILKDRYEKPALLEVLPEYNARMAHFGATIISLRAQYVAALSREAAAFHASFSGGKETLQLQYQTVSNIEDPTAPVQELYQLLSEHQARHRQAELESGQCLSGPHKDDFEAKLGVLPIRSFGSQGQTRTAAISLKLAEREILRRQLKEEPILLLDDVLSELDSGRQDFVLNQLGGGQVFITCCEKDRVTNIGQVLRVENGQILPL